MEMYVVTSGEITRPHEWGAFDTRERALNAAKGLALATGIREQWWVVTYKVNEIMPPIWECVVDQKAPKEALHAS